MNDLFLLLLAYLLAGYLTVRWVHKIEKVPNLWTVFWGIIFWPILGGLLLVALPLEITKQSERIINKLLGS